jgi:hypothetical protein
LIATSQRQHEELGIDSLGLSTTNFFFDIAPKKPSGRGSRVPLEKEYTKAHGEEHFNNQDMQTKNERYSRIMKIFGHKGNRWIVETKIGRCAGRSKSSRKLNPLRKITR